MQQVIVDFGQVKIFGHPLALRIYGYGLMLVLGFVLGIWLAWWRARRAGEDHHAVATLGLLALVAGVLGARLAFVIERWEERFAPLRAQGRDPLAEMLNITSGGLIYYGGVALAIVVILLYLCLRRLPVRRYLDIITPSLMIGLAFGRMGCLLNGCCYGGRCHEHFPLAMRFPYASAPLWKLDDEPNLFGGASVSPLFGEQRGSKGMDEQALPAWIWVRDAGGRVVYAADEPGGRPKPSLKPPAALSEEQAREALSLRSLPVQPAQAYGIFNALLLAGLLLCFSRLRWREGQVFALMLILYPMTRIALESIRGDNPHNLLRMQLTHNQWTSLATTAAGLLLWFGLWLLPKDCGPAWRERLAAVEVRKPKHHRHRKGRS